MGIKNQPIFKPCPECGTQYAYRRASGRTFEVCELCRQKNCVICGKKVPLARGKKNTCCEQCAADKTRLTQNRFYVVRFGRDPDLHKKRHAAAKAAREQDPEKMAAYCEKERQRHELRKQDPKYQVRRQAYGKQYHAKNRDEILQKRRDFFDGLSAAEKAERAEKQREASRVWRAAHRAELKTDPEKWAAYQAAQRRAVREHNRRRALAELMIKSQELIKND